MIRRNVIRNAAAGAKLPNRLPRLVLALALLAGCGSRGAGCGLGNGCAGTAGTELDGEVTTTAATLDTTNAEPRPTAAAPPAPSLSPSGSIQPAQPEVSSYVPVPVPVPALAADAAPPVATAPPAETAVAPAATPAPTPETRATAPAPSAPPQRQYSSEEIMSSSAVLAPRGYELSETGAGPFSNGAGGPTGFPSDDAGAR